ncbi:MAG: hypothetical protein QG673_596 [Pseudomonadota bacterium]|nr:hypothetical protein [Pseudomonadota bacterium]
MKNKVKLFVFWLIPIVLSIIAIFGISRIRQDVENIKNEQKQLINQVKSISITAPANISNKQVFVLQDQVSKIQDFEDRRYNAITTQLNSFWSGVNGFLALIGIFFALFSWYLTKQVESANTNIKEIQDELDKAAASREKIQEYQTNIEQFIESKSVELFKSLVKQDVAEQIDELISNPPSLETKFDYLVGKVKYITAKQWKTFADKLEQEGLFSNNDRLFIKFLALSLIAAPDEISKDFYSRLMAMLSNPEFKKYDQKYFYLRVKFQDLNRINVEDRNKGLIMLVKKYSTIEDFEKTLTDAEICKENIDKVKQNWLNIK